MLLKSNRVIKCHTQYIKVIKLLQPKLLQLLMGVTWDPLRVTRRRSYSLIESHHPEVTRFTNLDAVTVQGLWNCNSIPLGWQNSCQSGVIGITDNLILQYGKKLRGEWEDQKRQQTTVVWHSWDTGNQFSPTTVLHNMLCSIWLILNKSIPREQS